jgi:hypothetical protein
MEITLAIATIITIFVLGEIADRRAGYGTTLREYADAFAEPFRR